MEKLPAKVVRERLSQWDSKLATISDTHKDLFVELSSSTLNRPFQDQLQTEKFESKSSKKPTPTTIADRMDQICNTQDLLRWFDEMDTEIQSTQDAVYRDYSSHLQQYSTQCSDMLSQLSSTLEALNDMKEKHQFVSNKTQALHEACEQLVQEQNQLSQFAEGISHHLAYFTELELLGQKLNAPTFLISPESLPIFLTRLDECIAFIEAHLYYKESPIYLARYKQQLSRALATVKQQVTHTLKSTTQNVLPQQSIAGKSSNESSYSQIYGKFRSSAPKIKALMKEIESRVKKSPEYSTLLNDCLQCYCTQRRALLTPSITSTMQEISQQHNSSSSGFLRAGCNFLSRVCLDEYHLYSHFFSESSDELSKLLEDFCYQVYDTLRPVVIHINHLETLTDLCSILKVEIIEELAQPKGDQLATFNIIIKQLLGDIQQRLVFRAQRYIQSDIAGYKPAPGDLAYPDKLIVMAEAQSSLVDTFSDTDSVFDTESDAGTPDASVASYSLGLGKKRAKGRSLNELHAMWYPTVRRTLMCLSKLYRCLERPVFEGLAQEALSECVKTLQTAGDIIKVKKSQIDGSLFLIKHLLILREQIAAFNVNFSVREVYLDFTKTKAAAFNLLKQRSRMFSLNSNNAFLEFVFEGIPELIETQLDSKKEVDAYLKTSCEQFITNASSSLSLPLKNLLDRFHTVLDIADKEGHNVKVLLSKQPFANPSEVHTVVCDCNMLLKDKVPEMRKQLSIYLCNQETELILFRPIKSNVLNLYHTLGEIALKYFSYDDQKIISCPTQQELDLLLSVSHDPL